MAFGFGFNKQKVLSTAEKFVQQGRLPNAIAEYEKILKADPKDLTVMNTIGDLYARVGNNEKAVECFKAVGDAYASQGFTVKAIAMYKKLGKLKSSLESVLRLAELYTQQGLFNDARAQYLQVAEEFLREGQLEQAVRIFQKTLEMDPENITMRTKLAEVYVRLNKKTEAWQIFSAAAETLRQKGQLDAAEEILQRMLKLDPGSSYALLMRGRTAFDSGDMAGAISHLEKVADLDSNADGLRTLMQAYLQSGRVADAGNLATKLISVHNDVASVLTYANALIDSGHFDEALKVYEQHCDRLLAADTGKVLETLHSLIGHVRDNTAALEKLLQLLQKAGDTTHLSEIHELLAHAFVQSGELEKARDYYLKLTQLEPENQLHARNYQQVLGKLGISSTAHLITAEEGAVLVDELEATAPFVDQRYADDVALSIRAALTDAELFISYNMPAKALAPLLSALPQAPRDLRINQKLAALHTRAGRFTEAAVCCRTLESIYHEAGQPDEATRYGELAAKYEERAASAGSAPDADVPMPTGVPELPVRAEAPAMAAEPEIAAPVMPAQPPVMADETQAGTEFAVHPELPPQEELPAQEEEIDISAEWEGEISDQPPVPVEQAAAESAPVAEAAEEGSADDLLQEIRFYLSNGMTDEAQASFRKLRRLQPDEAQLATIRSEIEAAMTQAPAAVEPESVAVDDDPVPPAAEPEAVPAASSNSLTAMVSDLESAVGEDFLPKPAVAQETHAPAPQPKAPAEPAAQSPAALTEFVSDLEASLGDGFLAEAPALASEAGSAAKIAAAKSEAAPVAGPIAKAAAAAQSSAPAASANATGFTYQPTPVRQLGTAAPAGAPGGVDAGARVDLAGMFGELKQELEEDSAATDEDPETHYNLGVAFREMGLLDEAIAELQKVCQAADRGQQLPQIMQTYTWLAQCFLDKGVPEAAIRWYEKALKLPNLDLDTRTALHYELGSSYEAAGNRPDALKHFMDVYGNNIDYRDVAERVKTLKS
jgi:tetratricopeptide (TPR) repeat protein